MSIAKEDVQGWLRALGLMPKEGEDPTKTEPGAAGTALYDNTLQITDRTKKLINAGGGAGVLVTAGTAVWTFLQDRTSLMTAVLPMAVLALGIVLAAWGLGIAWTTQTDLRARAAISVETMKARGVVAAALVEFGAGAPARDADGGAKPVTEDELFRALALAMAAGEHGDITTEKVKNEKVTSVTWRSGKPVEVRVPHDLCDPSEIREISLR